VKEKRDSELGKKTVRWAVPPLEEAAGADVAITVKDKSSSCWGKKGVLREKNERERGEKDIAA